MIINELYEIINITVEKYEKLYSPEIISYLVALVVNEFLAGKIITSNNNYYNLINDTIYDFSCKEFFNVTLNFYKQCNKDNTINSLYKIFFEDIENNFIKYGKRNYELRDNKNKIYISKIPGTIGGHKKLKIYGRMDCKSANMWIKKGLYTKERVFFHNEKDAIEAGYRPCAVCMPDEYNEWRKKLR